LEYLDARGGQEDVFEIASDTNREFGRVITVVKAVELLDFVDTPKRMVILSPEGRRFVKAGTMERRALWREQLLKLKVFKDVWDRIQKHPRKGLNADAVLEYVVLHLPYENYEKIFEAFVRWAQFGDLLYYDEPGHKIFLRKPRRRSAAQPAETSETTEENSAGNGETPAVPSTEAPTDKPPEPPTN
jgi:NitT/TauT family transport system ATP-binding protein